MKYLSIADCPLCHRGSDDGLYDKAGRISDYLEFYDCIPYHQIPQAIKGLHFLNGHENR